MKRGVLLGPPGAGKGTQATWLCEHLGVPLVATGETFRLAVKEGSALGKQAESYMSSGALVPDELVINLVLERLGQPSCANGFILDGFPRTLEQCNAIEAHGIDLDWVVIFHIPDEAVIERLSQRRVHPASGRIYHLTFNPPQKPGVDDVTGEPLIQRDDDHPDTIAKRLKVYHAQTAPLIEFYQQRSDRIQLIELDAQKPVASVREDLQRVF